MRSNRSLPPLLALRAFEAVARHGSMTRASAELLITQSAISHHIRALEGELGAQLFARHARGIALTDLGKQYYEAIETAFATISTATAGIRVATASPVVRVSVLPSFTAHWLVPRLARFRARHPNIILELDPTLGRANFSDGVDVAIRYGDGTWPGVVATLLMTERITPVIASTRASDVDTLPLLLTSRSFDWKLWWEAAGHDFTGNPRLQLTDYNVAIQAALNGEGLAMGRLRLIQNRLDRGELIAPFPLKLETPAAAYWCVYPKDRKLSPATLLLLAWIKDEIAVES